MLAASGFARSAAAAVLIAAGAPIAAENGATAASGEAAPIPGFSSPAASAQHRLEAELAERLDPTKTDRHFRHLTAEPHPAGSERNYELAEYVRDRFEEYGLEEVELLRYDVYLPLPQEVSVRMVEPESRTFALKEDAYEVDPDSAGDAGITYTSMSASGEVTAPVIYAHSGNPEDYDWLESHGIDPAGKIAIVRYSVPYSYRGFKAYTAEQRGVKALLIYSDPKEDGYLKGEVFPDGPWGPESHIQRGAITYDFIVPGDPLTPGWPSIEGAERVAREEARSVPGIVAVPMSWRDARPILERLAGPVAPEAWQGGLPIEYRVGPGPAKLEVRVEMDETVRPIWVVVGKIRGSEAPDETVILGNHRDAWVYGGVDPSSGTATQLELARILGALAREGQRPRRTLVLASWDAEEVHLTGSTEWGEQFAEELSEGAVAYLNVDSSTSGPDFAASAVASLNPTVLSVARDVLDPSSGGSLLEAWSASSEADGASGRGGTDVVGLVENELGSGSDYTVFLNYLGIPIVDLTFDGPYGVYHSQYDDYYWVTHIGDPGLRYMTAMVEVWGRLALRLANAEVHPYDFRGYAALVTGFLDDLAKQPGVARNLDLSAARAAVEVWAEAAARLETDLATVLAGDGVGDPSDLNRTLRAVERQLLLTGGIPDRPWFKHALYAPRYTYAAMSLPGVQEAIDAEDWARAKGQLVRLSERLEAVATQLTRAAVRAKTTVHRADRAATEER